MKTTIIFLLVFLKVFLLQAQPENGNKTIKVQKLYLHTDREFYFSGDTLWFAAYLVDGMSHTFSDIEGFTSKKTLNTCNLYIDIINAEGEIVLDELFILKNGFCSGYVPFADSAVSEGNFLLRASTDYLKNFGDDAFFTKTIRVSEVKSSFELRKSEGFIPGSSGGFTPSETLTKTKIDVSFLPEGGFLLAEESNCVAFKAIDENGFGKNISGKLFDENGKLVLTFKSIYKGAGKFYFYPKTGKKYTAKIDGFPNLEFTLSEIRETGAKIKLVNQEDERIKMVIQAKKIKYPLQLVCWHRGKIMSKLEIDRKKANAFLILSTQKLGAGINRFVLLDKNSNPLSERLVFQNDKSICHLEIRLGEENYSTREEVQLNIKADDLIDELAQVSISVVDENYVKASGVSQNIASYLLFDSELKGHIETPADYFISTDSISSQTKLDLLMCTNGWSNYIWNSFKEDPVEIKFKPQLGFTFKGNVKRFMGKKALSEGNVSMILFKSDSTSAFFDQPLDLNGNFEFRNIAFYDSASVFAQARNKKDKHNIQFEMQLHEIVPPKINFSNLLQLLNYSSIPYSVYRQRYLNEMRMKEFYPDKNNILVDEIEVTAKKPKPKFKTGIPKKNDGPFKLTWEMTAGSFDIVEYLAYKVPGIISWRNDDNELMIKLQTGIDIGVPAFFIDDFNYYSINEIKGWNVSDFKMIEIITPPMSYAYGARAKSGAVVLTLKRGDEIDPTMPLFGGIVERVNGFTPLREFYSPKYTPQNVNSEAPDFRNTLYWNPKVTVANGEHELEFFTCDNVSRYKVFIEGITESGKICLGTGEFEVNRFREIISEGFTPSETLTKTSEAQAKTNDTLSNTAEKNFITGTIKTQNAQPIEFATLFNSTQKTSAITNAKGEFNLEAQIGDSVKIQHLNYATTEYKILQRNPKFILVEKDFLIEEVVVSPQIAFDLFNKSCENTWNTFKVENHSRAFVKCTRTLYGEVVAQEALLDLDVIQKKLHSYKNGEKTNVYRIQEKMEKHGKFPENDFLLDLNLFYPEIQQIYWVDLPKSFNYLKRVESNFIKLILSNKKNYDYKCNIEVTINKTDTTLHSFAMVKKDIKLPFLLSKLVRGNVQETWDTIPVQKTYHFIKYDYSDGFGYLSEYVQGAIVKPDREIEISEHFKTYKNGAETLSKRKNRKRIFNNRIVLKSVKNRYENEFWKNGLFPGKIPYDFKRLENLKID